MDFAKDKLVIYDHSGNYVKSDQLPFKAHKVKKLKNTFLFEVSPYTRNGGLEPCKVIVTDLNYKILNRYISHEDSQQGYRVTRSIYFGGGDAVFFSPIMGNGIYQIDSSELKMNYYIKFPKEIGLSAKKLTLTESLKEKYYPIYDNALTNSSNIFQILGSGKRLSKLLVIDRINGKSVIINKIINNRDDIIEYRNDDLSINFDFTRILGYNQLSDEFYGVFDLPTISALPIKYIEEIKSKLSPEYHEILLGDNNQILFFIKMKKYEFNN